MNAPIWKVSVQLAKVDVPRAAALFELSPPAPQAVTILEDPFTAEASVEALYEAEPDAMLLSDLIGATVSAVPLPDQDWIGKSQEGLPPVRAGRFFVYGAHDAGTVPPGIIPIRIEAGLAFGTGHHETTSLCLAALSTLAKRKRFFRVLDLGCGTGVLAIAAVKLWRRPVIATDIDPIAVEVARANARANSAGPFIRVAIADGLDHPALRGTHFDLIVANILAGPLTRLAPAIARRIAPGDTIVLSGLLRWQEQGVLSFYRSQGMIWRQSLRDGPWTALVLEAPGGTGLTFVR